MKKFFKVFAIGIFFLPFSLCSQDIIFPNDLPSEYIFNVDSQGTPTLITKNRVFRLKNKWTYSDLEKDSVIAQNLTKSLDRFNNENFVVLNKPKEVLLALSGGGHVLSLNKNLLSRIDNSVNQRNQFQGSTFYYKDKLYICLLYTSPSPRDKRQYRMPSSA